MPTIVAERGTVSWELWGVGVIRQKLNQIWAEHRQSSLQIAVTCDFEATFPQADRATVRGTVYIVELVGDRPARVKTRAEVESKLLQEGERIESLFLGTLFDVVPVSLREVAEVIEMGILVPGFAPLARKGSKP